MKAIFLTVLLMSTGVIAQTGAPLPALGAATATPTSAPATALPATGTATASAGAPLMLLSAPVGSSTALNMTSKTHITLSDVQVNPAPGAHPKQELVNNLRRSFSQSLNAIKNQPDVVSTGKTLFKVTGRDAVGNVTLLTTVMQNVPAPDGTTQPLSFKITQTVSSPGQSKPIKIESDNPQLNAVFKTLTPEKLQQLSERTSGATVTYGVPLTVGVPKVTTATLDTQELMGTVIGAAVGPKGQQLVRNFKASPLTVTTAATYRGQDAQGLKTFETQSHAQPWQINMSLPIDGQTPISMSANLSAMNASSKSVYRPDGLPIGINQNTNMKIQITMVTQGVQVNMTMNSAQAVTMQGH